MENGKKAQEDNGILEHLRRMGMSVVEIPIDDPLRMSRPPFDTSSFKYRIIAPSDGTITREELLERIGFSREQYINLMQLIAAVNENVINIGNQLSREEEIRYSKFIDSLLSKEKMIKIISEASKNKISIFNQMLYDCGFLQEGKGADLNQEIEIINYLIGYVSSVILELVNGTIEGGLSASIGRSDNYKYYSAIILSALLQNIVELRIINPMAIALSQASDYLSPSELHEIIRDISQEEWSSVKENIREDVISSSLLGMFINIINDEQKEVGTLLMRTIRSLSSDIEGLKGYITKDVEAVFVMAVKFNRSELVKFILSNCLSIIEKSLITGELNTVFYYDMKKLMAILFSALIRGDSNTCLKFFHSAAWKDYKDQEKIEIVKFIILRSGSVTREVLLREIFTNKDLKVAKLSLYTELLNNAQSEEEYGYLKEVISPFIVEHIAGNWLRDCKDPRVNSELIQIGTIHTLVEVAREDQEDSVLKDLHARGILTFSLYVEVFSQSEGELLKEKVRKLFTPYIKELCIKKYGKDRDVLLKNKSSTMEEFVSAFRTLSSDERKKLFQDISSSIKGIIKDESLNNKQRENFIQAKRQKLEWIIENKLIDLEEKKRVDGIIDNIIQFNTDTLLAEEGETSKPKSNKKHKKKSKFHQEKKISEQSGLVINEITGMPSLVDIKEGNSDSNKKDKKKEATTSKSQSESALLIELSKEEGWNVVSKKSSEVIDAYSDSKSGGPNSGGGAVKSSRKSKPEYKPGVVKTSKLLMAFSEELVVEKKLETLPEGGKPSYKNILLKMHQVSNSLDGEIEESNTRKINQIEIPQGEIRSDQILNSPVITTEESSGEDVKLDKVSDDLLVTLSSVDKEATISESIEGNLKKDVYEVVHPIIEYSSYLGPNGVHFEAIPMRPVVQIECNAIYLGQDGTKVPCHMDLRGNCVDIYGNHFWMPPILYHRGANFTNYDGYGGYGGGGSDGVRVPKNKKVYGNYGKKHRSSVEEESAQGNSKELILSILSSLFKVKVVHTEREEYQEALQEINKRQDDYKVQVRLDSLHHFESKSQNVSYVSISKDEDMMPKLSFGESSMMFIGEEKLNIDPVYM